MKTGKILITIMQFVLIVGLGAGMYYLVTKRVSPTTAYCYVHDLTSGTVLGASDIKAVEIPKDGVTESMKGLKQEDILGMAINVPVHKGNYITKSELVKAEKMDALASLDRSSMVKIAIPVSLEDSLGGDIDAGNRVNLSYVAEEDNKDQSAGNSSFIYGKTFMENIVVYKVLTENGTPYVNQTEGLVYNSEGEPIESDVPANVVLAVTPEQFEEITTRMEKGTVKIAGRFLETQDKKTSGYVLGNYSDVTADAADPEGDKGTAPVEDTTVAPSEDGTKIDPEALNQ